MRADDLSNFIYSNAFHKDYEDALAAPNEKDCLSEMRIALRCLRRIMESERYASRNHSLYETANNIHGMFSDLVGLPGLPIAVVETLQGRWVNLLSAQYFLAIR